MVECPEAILSYTKRSYSGSNGLFSFQSANPSRRLGSDAVQVTIKDSGLSNILAKYVENCSY